MLCCSADLPAANCDLRAEPIVMRRGLGWWWRAARLTPRPPCPTGSHGVLSDVEGGHGQSSAAGYTQLPLCPTGRRGPL